MNNKMVQSDTLVFMVVHPAAVNFMGQCLSSLAEQDDPDFDVFILTDDLPLVTVEHTALQAAQLNYKFLKAQGTIAENRQVGIDYALERHYDYLIFCDSDDYFRSDRVRITKRLLAANPSRFVVNDLTIVDQCGQCLHDYYYSRRMLEEDAITLPFLLEKNICGLSNTAVHTAALKNVRIPSDVVAVDWFVFSSLTLGGCLGYFTNKTVTYYRQHENNCIGIARIQEPRLESAIEIKLKHLKAMAPISPLHRELLARFKSIIGKFYECPEYAMKLTKEVTRSEKSKFPFWWESLEINRLELL